MYSFYYHKRNRKVEIVGSFKPKRNKTKSVFKIKVFCIKDCLQFTRMNRVHYTRINCSFFENVYKYIYLKLETTV